MIDREENLGVIYDRKDYAGFLKRLVIAVVDLLVIVALSAGSFTATDNVFHYWDSYVRFNFFFTVILAVIYLAVFKRSRYRTVGYILTGVKIVDLKGKRPSLFKMILRVLLLLIGPFELFIDLFWLTSEATKQTLRDKYIGTYVVNRHAVPTGRGKLQHVTLGVLGWNLMYREVKESQIP